MRLLRLKLENWRGVDAREIRFSENVTIVEGPNEAGKTSLVQALLTLIKELDSTKKQEIKAVMPVGRDVGSRVEAEIETGPYHFVYAKTYNKSPETTLEILAPKGQQLTGREAHERAEQMLSETVDLALWEALLVEQGEKIAMASLQDSEGLAHALDEAAGSGAAGHEDMDLYDAVRAEYEQYFTVKTGRPKFADLEKDFERARRERDAAEIALAEVDKDADAHERAAADVRRRRAELPVLREKLAEHEKRWQAMEQLKSRLELKQQQLAVAESEESAAEKALAEREALGADIVGGEETLAKTAQEARPLEERAGQLKEQLEAARQIVAAAKQKRKAAQLAKTLAEEDRAHLENLETLRRDEQRVESLTAVNEKLRVAVETVGAIAIDEKGLEALRAAERRLDLATSKRDLAATTVTVTAQKALDLAIDDEDMELDPGKAETRTAAAELTVRIPGVAAITVTPPQSAAELETELDDAESALRKSLDRHRVANLAEAIEQQQARQAAQQDVERYKSRAEEIRGGDTEAEIEQTVRTLRERCESYAERRSAETALPDTLTGARDALADATRLLADKEAAVEDAQEKEDTLRGQQAQAAESLRAAREQLIALEATLQDKKQRLASSRAEASDDALESRLREAASQAEQLRATTTAARAQLEQLAPDTIETLYANARSAAERAERELASAEQNLAVLADRLQRAQADGRFETLEAAERSLEESGDRLQATQRRAAAASRLWETLNRHRDAARQAYVQPLKEAIERLGRIVFGPDFEVTIADDWTLESRSLDGTTLPFEHLSIGAKEQLGILTRLAAARIVATQGGVPLIIDDALGFSDPSRLETMGAAISAAGKDCQIIILTCTPGRFTHVGTAEVVGF